MRRVTLLTDFGTADGYAAAMAGVVAAGVPDALVEHASHELPQGDIFSAALTLSRYASLYPAGTVHVVVVDPGVGTERAALAATIDDRHFVAPDNGVLTLVLRSSRQASLVRIDDPQLFATASATFHGRDIFAPAAARLAAGMPLEQLGTTLDEPVLLEWPVPRRDGGRVLGEVVGVDRFGNLISNVPVDWLPEHADVRVEDRSVGGVRRTYGDVEPDALVALVGSLETLEVSVRDGSAAERLGAARGARITVVTDSSPVDADSGPDRSRGRRAG